MNEEPLLFDGGRCVQVDGARFDVLDVNLLGQQGMQAVH